jgi:hypothetical protein
MGRPLERPVWLIGDNIKTGLNNTIRGCTLVQCNRGYGLVAGSREHGTKPSYSVNGRVAVS